MSDIYKMATVPALKRQNAMPLKGGKKEEEKKKQRTMYNDPDTAEELIRDYYQQQQPDPAEDQEEKKNAMFHLLASVYAMPLHEAILKGLSYHCNGCYSNDKDPRLHNCKEAPDVMLRLFGWRCWSRLKHKELRKEFADLLAKDEDMSKDDICRFFSKYTLSYFYGDWVDTFVEYWPKK